MPLFAPRPIEPSQLEAAAAAPPIVVEFELAPTRPPVVRMRSPARPPDKNVLSLLYSGDNATVWTGRPKFRSMTSLGSTNDEMHTFPSMEEVAMYIEFEGIAGTAACWLLGCPRRLAELEEDLLGSWSSVKVEALVNGSGLKVGRGGGNGETEIDVTLAEWA